MNKIALNIHVPFFIAEFVCLRSGASHLAIQSYRICALTEIRSAKYINFWQL
jgi:hypothetical protein